ncbi:MAG TPA: hypothetical protein VM802_29595 [Chitinophaga sp.]|uniref:Kelch repeat-containing protein n=1 Tax=Chitinophaga sp. TaxID=1869181 RepID=UPI002CBBE0B5|nr:hypothetical protein [Chitinophaga sp.]HVI49057.1 hypothetical protein [Chitinophaga sp.]
MNCKMKTIVPVMAVLLASSCTKNLIDKELQPINGTLKAAVATNPLLSYTKLEQTGTLRLSIPRADMGITASNGKIYFAGGTNMQAYVQYTPDTALIITGGHQSIIDIYDTATQTWGQANLSSARTDVSAVTAGSKVLFAGGNLLDTVNIKPGTNPKIKAPRAVATTTVDLYDTNSKQWTVASLSKPRYGMSGAAIGNKAYFAGGVDSAGNYQKIVDVYDATTNQWSTIPLPYGMKYSAAVARGNEIIFVSNIIQILNTINNTWTIHSVTFAYFQTIATLLNDKVCIADRTSHVVGNVNDKTFVEVYTTLSANTSFINLPTPRTGVGLGSIGNKLILAGGGDISDEHQTADIYDDVTHAAVTVPLTSGGAMNMQSVTVGNKLYMAGGRRYPLPTRRVAYPGMIDVFELKP